MYKYFYNIYKKNKLIYIIIWNIKKINKWLKAKRIKKLKKQK